MAAAGVAGGGHAQLARRIGRQEIALDDTVGHHLAIAGRNAIVVKWTGGQTLRDMRSFADGEEIGKDALAKAVGQE